MKFYDNDHETLFHHTLKKMSYIDPYRKTAAYLLSLDRVCREHMDRIFDFNKGVIITEGLDETWQTGTSSKTTRLLFNLWNGWCVDREPDMPISFSRYDDDNEDAYDNIVLRSRNYTPYEIFDSCYAPYYWEAIRILFSNNYEGVFAKWESE